MSEIYNTAHTKRHWYQWPVVVIVSAILWVALGLFLVIFQLGEWILDERICGE